MILRYLWVSLAFALTLAQVPAKAQVSEGFSPSPVQVRGTLQAKVGRGSVLTLPSEIERLALADETIARAQIISSREGLLTGVLPGQTTVIAWLADGRRLQYGFKVTNDISFLQRSLTALDPGLTVEASDDGASIVLAGTVPDARTARRAVAYAEQLSDGATVVDFVDYPGAMATSEDFLQGLMEGIDPRIRVRRLELPATQDTEDRSGYVLEGRVRTINELRRAVQLAELHLGGTAGKVEAPNDQKVQFSRNQNFGGGGGAGAGGRSGSGGANLQGAELGPPGLAAQVSRGLAITSGSGRVVALLEVDELPQIQVAIRVLEVDRARAKKLGVNFRLDYDNVSIGNYTGPQGSNLPGLLGAVPEISAVNGAANVVAAFVDGVTSIATAIDFLSDRNLARSVAEPNITTLSGEQASVLVGGEVPIPVSSSNAISTSQGVAFQDFGVRLDIRPTLGADGVVTMEVVPSIVRPSLALSVNNVPGFTIQTVQTTTRVQVGQSLVIGGLLSFQESLEDRRLPGLGAFPLFRWKRRAREERELMFVITPRVVTEGVLDAEEDLKLPELQFPADRDSWRDIYEPEPVDATGVPFEFRRDDLSVDDVDWTTLEASADRTDETLVSARGDSADGYDAEGYDDEFAQDGGLDDAFETEGASDDTFPQRGWIVAADVEPCLNIRPSPTFAQEASDCIDPGAQVEVLDSAPGWRHIRTSAGASGWAAASFLERGASEWMNDDAFSDEPSMVEEAPPSEAWVVSFEADPCLNVRPSPDQNNTRMDCIEPGLELAVVGESGIWRRVRLLDGREGWVSSRFLVPHND